MSYYFFMDAVQLPVPPPKMQLKIGSKNQTMNLINGGEINILKTPGLAEVSFELLLPNVQYPFAKYIFGFRKAEYFLNHFNRLKAQSKPFQFIVCRMTPRHDLLFDTNLTVSMEDYEIIEDAHNGFDVVASIRLKQYKPYATKTLTVKTKANGTKSVTAQKARRISKEISKAYKVATGQVSLWEVCKTQMGDGEKWPEIAKLNGIVNPNNLSVKQVIKLVK